MWLARGVQSAVFYYATCTPCAAAVDRRRRKREAARSQRELAKSTVIITDQPRPFAQPAPFSTNPGWIEEISLGPGPPARRHRTNKNCQPDGTGLPRLSATSSTTVEDTTISSEQEKAYLKTPLGERFHWARYQREDEVLWGEEEQPVQGSSVGFSGRARAETSHSSKYYIGRAPPVNDLHPPIVSGPTSRSETRWMLQPPPSARVMAGKARHDSVRNSREPSIRKKSRMDMRIEETGEEDEIKKGQSIPVTERPSWRSSGSTKGNRKATDKKRRPAPVTVVKDSNLSSDSLSPDASPRYPPPATLASRPESMAHTRHAYDEWHFQISSTRSDSPSSLGSPLDSFHCPDTPYSRPESERTNDSGKAFRSPYSNLGSPMGRHTDKSIEAIRVEVNEPKVRDEMKPLKWRWSFDV